MKTGQKPKIDKTVMLRMKRAISGFHEKGEKINTPKLMNACEITVSQRTVQRKL